MLSPDLRHAFDRFRGRLLLIESIFTVIERDIRLSTAVGPDTQSEIATVQCGAVIVVTDIYSSYQHPMIERLRELLRPRGLGVLCVTGRALESYGDKDGCRSIYQLAATMDVAGVIILAGTLGHKVAQSTVERLISDFTRLPMVTIGMETDFCPSVQPDNGSSMRTLVRHMTADPKRQNFVFLRGFSGCPSSAEREEAFREVLTEKGLEVDESLVLSGSYYASEAQLVTSRLLDERQDIHGVVAANDAMASGVLLALEQHGLRVPEDVIVSGFDDSEYAVCGSLPITTVRSSIVEQMEIAAELLIGLIDNGENDSNEPRRVPGELLIRESSGLANNSTPGSPTLQCTDSLRDRSDGIAAPYPLSATEFQEFLAYHEISERMYIKLSRSTDRETIFDIFCEAMESLSINRAFVVMFEDLNGEINDRLQLGCSYPRRVVEGAELFYPAAQLLPDFLIEEFSEGVLVATAVVLENELAGALLYDPGSAGGITMDGLAQSLFGALRQCQQREFLKAQAQKLETANANLVHMANFDSLTGLANRTRLRGELDNAVAVDNARLVVLYIDLDGFKLINDTMGHDAGDKLLTIVSSRVRKCVRSVDIVARLGGDEFAILITEVDDSDIAQSIADQLLAAIAMPMQLSEQQTITLSASIGVAQFPEHGKDAETLLKHADTAMYKAKAEGRNRIFWFSEELNVKANEQLRLDQSMRDGLENGEFRLAFQPRLDLRSEAVVGVEALLRWTTADGTEITPGEFIPIAEQTGFIRRLDAFALDTACAQAAAWRRRGLVCRMAVNLSISRLQQDDIVEQVRKILSRHDVPVDSIEFEVTESAAMSDLKNNIDKLEAFSAMGIRLSIDDFGTAYSSLSYLKNLPVNCLKIDRSFLSAIESIEDEMSPDARIIRAVIGLGNSLGLQIVAEGVENEVQHQFLMKLGCDEAQGFLFGRPLEVAAIESVLEEFGEDGTHFAEQNKSG